MPKLGPGSSREVAHIDDIPGLGLGSLSPVSATTFQPGTGLDTKHSYPEKPSMTLHSGFQMLGTEVAVGGMGGAGGGAHGGGVEGWGAPAWDWP